MGLLLRKVHDLVVRMKFDDEDEDEDDCGGLNQDIRSHPGALSNQFTLDNDAELKDTIVLSMTLNHDGNERFHQGERCR